MLVILLSDLKVVIEDLVQINCVQVLMVHVVTVNFLHIREVLEKLMAPIFIVIDISLHVFRPLLAVAAVDIQHQAPAEAAQRQAESFSARHPIDFILGEEHPFGARDASEEASPELFDVDLLFVKRIDELD